MNLQENKNLLAILVAAVVVVVGGGVGWWFTAKSAEKSESLVVNQNQLVDSLGSTPQGVPAPLPKNVELLEEQVVADRGALLDLLQELTPYTFAVDGSDFPSAVQIGEVVEDRVNQQRFQSLLQQVFEQRRNALDAIGATYEDEFYFGMNEYRQRAPETDTSARFLAYQLGAMDAFFGVLTDANVDSISVKKRTKGALELKQQLQQEVVGNQAVLGGMPVIADFSGFEIEFMGTQEALQQAINYLSNNEDYFYQLRSFSILNEEQSAPTVQDVEKDLEEMRVQSEDGNGFGVSDGQGDWTENAGGGFEDYEEGAAENAGTGGFAAAFTVEGAAEEEREDAEFASGAREIAVQVLGDEKINVTLDVVLVTFRPMLPPVEGGEPSLMEN